MNIIIIAIYPQVLISSLKSLLSENNNILFIENELNISKLYNKIKNYFEIRDFKLINICIISLIEKCDEHILKDDDNNTFSIEELNMKIENECVNNKDEYLKINDRRCIYINLTDDTKNNDTIETANKIILNLNSNNINNYDINNFIIQNIKELIQYKESLKR